jgi:proline iminopeptidase
MSSPPMHVPRAGSSARSSAARAVMRKWLAAVTGTLEARLGAAIGVAAIAAALVGAVMPRGPITTADAFVSMAIGVLVGFSSGFAMRSRWAMLVAPLTFMAVFEGVRIGESGPTVDGIHLGSVYGIAAFVTGRGLQGVLTLLPMVVGVSYGVAAFRRRERADKRHALGVGLVMRRIVLGLVSVALLALAVMIAKPASTSPILGADGKVLAGSVAELTRVKIGGHEQAVMIRGRSVKAPVLLFLAGGPGGSEIGSMRNLGAPLERHFVVATWDQRGTGKSADQFAPASTLTLAQSVSDTIAVTNYLRRRFDEQKIYLVGNSWGTIIGLLAARQHPELYWAYVGTGQMVNPAATDRMFYADTLAWAQRTGDSGLVDKLRRIGPPPYKDFWNYEPALSHEHDWNPYPGLDRFEEKGEMPGNILVKEYSLMEKLRTMPAFMDTFAVLYPQLKRIDFRRTLVRLPVPVYLVQGAHEARGRAVLADDWFARLQAPHKQRFIFARSGHKPSFEEPAHFDAVMTNTVLADTAAANR